MSNFLVSFSGSKFLSKSGCRALPILVLAALWALSAPALAEPSEASDDERFTLLVAPVAADEEGEDAHASVEQVAEATVQRFRSLWSDQDYGDGLASASDEAIALRLRAAETAMFYRQEPWILARFDAVLAEANARQLATTRYYRKLFDAYLAAFRFEDAAALSERYPTEDLPTVPEVLEPPKDLAADERVIWQVGADYGQMEGKVLKMDKPRLVVVTAPGCGFCNVAAEKLAEDEILAPLMREHAIWITGPSLNNPVRAIAQWNERYPDTPTFLAGDPGEWPDIDFHFIPRFIFFESEKIQEHFVGWPGHTKSLEAIANGFAGLGLLDTEAIPDDAFVPVDEPTGRLGCPERPKAIDQLADLAPISSREDMEVHLADIANGADSPLMNLSEQARIRLADSMSFRDGRAMGFRRIDDMMDQLEPEERFEVVSLFGMQYFYAGSLYPVELLNEAELDLRARLHCSGDYEVEQK